MNEREASAVAQAIGEHAQAWHSGGNIWLVMIERKDGSLVVISDDLCCAYTSAEAFHDGAEPVQSIELCHGF